MEEDPKREWLDSTTGRRRQSPHPNCELSKIIVMNTMRMIGSIVSFKEDTFLGGGGCWGGFDLPHPAQLPLKDGLLGNIGFDQTWARYFTGINVTYISSGILSIRCNYSLISSDCLSPKMLYSLLSSPEDSLLLGTVFFSDVSGIDLSRLPKENPMVTYSICGLLELVAMQWL